MLNAARAVHMQSPGVLLDLLMSQFRWVGKWSQEVDLRENPWWDAEDQLAAQWRAGSLLCKVSIGWLLAVGGIALS